jgi:hypothetical protein
MALIYTTKGYIDDSLLDRRSGMFDNSNEFTTWVEYRLPGEEEIIHRSAHVTLKRSIVQADVKAGDLNS